MGAKNCCRRTEFRVICGAGRRMFQQLVAYRTLEIDPHSGAPMKKLAFVSVLVFGLVPLMGGCKKSGVDVQVVDFLGQGEQSETITLTIGDCVGTFNIDASKGQQTLIYNLPKAGVYHYKARGNSVKMAPNGQMFQEYGYGEGTVLVEQGRQYQIFQTLHPNGGYTIELR
jgi:hypothetical protein